MRQFYHLVDIRVGFKPEKDWGVLLDRDGVVIKETPHLLTDFKDFSLFPQAIKAIKLLNQKGIPVFLTTNQTTVARGLVRHNFILKTHEKIKRKLAKNDAFLDGIFYCHHSPKADVKDYLFDCNWRKPKSGMLEFICQIFRLEPKKCFLIGDSARDILAAQKIKMNNILVLTGHAGKDSLFSARPDLVKKDILDAVRYILAKNE